jgi:hypothetical protein
MSGVISHRQTRAWCEADALTAQVAHCQSPRSRSFISAGLDVHAMNILRPRPVRPRSTQMPRILFAVHTSTVFVEPFRLAKLLAREGMEPIFTFAFDHWTADSFAQECDRAGIPVHKPRQLTGVWNRLSSKLIWLTRGLHHRWGWWGAHFLAELLDLRTSLARVNAAFDTLHPDLLVMSIDLAGYDTGAYVKVAHQRGCRVLLISSIMSIGLDTAEVYYHNRDYHVRGCTRRWLARAFPHWLLTHRGRDILRCPPGRVLAMELLRIAPPKPWLFNSSWADAFNMESDGMCEYYAAAGIPREQMVVTGSTSDDVMAAAQAQMVERRENLCRSLGLPADRPLILTALPPDFLDQPGGRPECDFREYGALVDFWMKTCCSVPGHNVIIALHPSVPPADAVKFERYGARVAPLNTAELVPLCDVFVASISSTIRWAIACGKPVVNYDVYRYRYTDFIGIEGVLTFEEQDEFVSVIRRITSDPAYAMEIRQKQVAVASLWGRLDGKSGQRMVDLVRRLLPSAA